ncbi:MAG: ABC transporter permease [Bacteroidota bacterium]
MFRIYLKSAWRNLIKDRQVNFLNLIGLSTGLACILLIYLWVNDEKSVDKFHKKDSRLFRVMQNNIEPAGIQTSEGAPGLLASAVKEEMPEVEDAATVKEGQGGILSFGNTHIKAKERYATKNFFNIFSFELLRGSKDQVLNDKHSIVVSHELAKKLFNTTENIIGKTIHWDRGEFSGPYTISGIFKELPANSSVQFDLLLSYDVFFDKYSSRLLDWGNSMTNTYVVLKKEAGVDKFNDKIRNFVKSKFAANGGDPKAVEYIPTLFLQRYSDQYLFNRFENGLQAGGRIEYVELFSIIAIFILVIACINFMNLSTAKVSGRVKEAGIKKIMGATRAALILQYIGESILMSFLSMIFAVAIVFILLPAFNQITGKQLNLEVASSFILSVLSIALFTGIVSGSYPALYLSGFKPAAVIKGKLKTSLSELFIRKGLVIFQFTLSVIFIVAVLVVYKQMNLIQNKNLGYSKDNIIQFSNEGKLMGNGLETFLTEVKNIPGVMNASSMRYSQKAPTGFGGLEWPGKKPGEDIQFGNLEVNYDLLELFGYQVTKGRSFSKQFTGENSKIIFNETAIAAMGLKDPVGKTISLYGKDYQVAGVVKDFHFESLHEKVKPCFFKLTPDDLPVTWNVVIKIRAGMEKETIARLDNFYKHYNLGLPFEYKFLDEDYQKLYASEQRVAVLSSYFATIAILISCLGLFGLAAFSAQKRQKEIGIRKVIGASVINVIVMLSKDFLKLVLVAILVGFPFAWWMMNKWLNDFAYRTDVGVNVFVITGVSVALITLLTISFQTIKAALANPVKSLRTE